MFAFPHLSLLEEGPFGGVRAVPGPSHLEVVTPRGRRALAWRCGRRGLREPGRHLPACLRGAGEGWGRRGGREAAISLGCSRSSLTWAQHHVEGPEKQRLWGDARVFLTAQQERTSGGSRVRFGEMGRG